MRFRKIVLASLLIFSSKIHCQQYTLKECIEKGKQNNVIIKLAEQSLQTREKLLQSNKNNNLPKVDFLGGYNYIGEPIKINLQQVKDGIVEGIEKEGNEYVYGVQFHPEGLIQTGNNFFLPIFKHLIEGAQKYMDSK